MRRGTTSDVSKHIRDQFSNFQITLKNNSAVTRYQSPKKCWECRKLWFYQPLRSRRKKSLPIWFYSWITLRLPWDTKGWVGSASRFSHINHNRRAHNFMQSHLNDLFVLGNPLVKGESSPIRPKSFLHFRVVKSFAYMCLEAERKTQFLQLWSAQYE